MNERTTEKLVFAILLVFAIVASAVVRCAPDFTAESDALSMVDVAPMLNRSRADAIEARLGRLESRWQLENRKATLTGMLTNKRVAWLRAMLHVIAHRHGRKLPRALSTWPEPAMKGIR